MPFSFDQPEPLEDAIAQISDKTPIGSILRTAEWSQMPIGLRQRAFFSAGVESVRLLSRMQEGLTSAAKLERDPATGIFTMDRARFIRDMQQLGLREGLKPADPRNQGHLRDITAEARLDLIFRTQMGMARGYSYWKQGLDPDVLDGWPAQELTRIRKSKVPRNWIQRWQDAGGDLFEGRMIALKTDGIWARISRFGTPFPPFDFNSGMGVEEIDRDEAERLGIISPGETQTPNVEDFNAQLEASVQNLDPRFAQALQNLFKGQIEISNGTARWTGSSPTPPKPVPIAPIPPPKSPGPTPAPPSSIQDIVKEMERAETAIKALGSGMLTPQQAQDLVSKCREAVSIPRSQRGTVKVTGRVSKNIQPVIRAGAEIVEAYTDAKYLPTISTRTLRSGAREYHQAGTVCVSRTTTDSTSAHEITHATERQNADVLKKAKDFLAKRTQGETPKSLRQLTGLNYRPHEMTLEDEWKTKGGDHYCGKIYPAATELLTMGIERLHRDPLAFYRQDPDYFSFVVSALRGW